jgi:hypothetical protein
MRYYFHGDVAEHNTGLVYCAKCDLFAPAAHFYETGAHSWSRHTDDARYKLMRKHFERRDRPLRMEYTRPPDAPNIFE